MIVEHLDIIFAGAVSLKSLLLLLLIPAQEAAENKNTQMLIDNVMSKNPKYKKSPEVVEMVRFIYTDGFKDETFIDQNNISYLYELKMLKDTISSFYFQSLSEVKGDYEKVCDLHTRIGKYLIQLMRLRMVIEPEVSISNNVHMVSKIDYLIAKSYWMNDEGKKVRKFTKSIGRLDEFDGGRESDKAKAEAKAKMQEVMYQHYKEIYN